MRTWGLARPGIMDFQRVSLPFPECSPLPIHLWKGLGAWPGTGSGHRGSAGSPEPMSGSRGPRPSPQPCYQAPWVTQGKGSHPAVGACFLSCCCVILQTGGAWKAWKILVTG